MAKAGTRVSCVFSYECISEETRKTRGTAKGMRTVDMMKNQYTLMKAKFDVDALARSCTLPPPA